MKNLERSALLWLKVFTLNPTRRINSEMIELYGVSRRRSKEIIGYLKDKGAILRKASVGLGSRWVLNAERSKGMLLNLESDGSPVKTSGW